MIQDCPTLFNQVKVQVRFNQMTEKRGMHEELKLVMTFIVAFVFAKSIVSESYNDVFNDATYPSKNVHKQDCLTESVRFMSNTPFLCCNYCTIPSILFIV